MITTAYRIEFDTGIDDPTKKWYVQARSDERGWKRSLNYHKKTYPDRQYRVVKVVTITETTEEILR